jgi:MFS family permease
MPSAHTPAPARSTALARYTATAVLARGADGGGGLGLVLLVLSPPTHIPHPGPVSGLLVAALSAPHLAGPLVARRLDTARDGRPVLATAFIAYGISLAIASVLLGRAPLVLAVLAIVAAGSCGPLLTGGLSSRLRDIAGPEPLRQRRAEGLDALTYGLGGTAGPAFVALLAAVWSPLVALLAMSGSAAAAGGLALSLPTSRRRPQDSAQESLSTRQALSVLWRTGPLRRVTLATMGTAFTGGGVGILAVHVGGQLSSWPDAGAALATAFGIGNLVGSLVITARPLRGDPERLTTAFVLLMGLAYAACAAAPTYLLALFTFGSVGALNAPFFAATLAARSAYSPAAARARVFVSSAGLKIAAAAVGTALTGALVGHGARPLLLAGGCVTALTAVACRVGRRFDAAGQAGAPMTTSRAVATKSGIAGCASGVDQASSTGTSGASVSGT